MKKFMTITLIAANMLIGIACGGGSSSDNGWNAESKQRLKSLASISLEDSKADCYVEYTTSHISYDKWVAEFGKNMASADGKTSQEDPFGEAMAKHCGYKYP